MLEFVGKNKGTISVFLTLILLPTFIFGGVIVDGSRILGAKNIISGAGDLTMNAALSNYHEELNKTYGLLGMAKTPEEVEDIMKDFFTVSLNAAGVSQEDFSKALIYLELTDDFSAMGVPESEIYRTEVIRQEIIEYMKYRAPVTLGERALEELDMLKDVKKEKNAADGQIKFESEMEGTQKLFDEIKECTDRLEELYKLVKSAREQNQMLNETDKAYDEICWLTVACQRMVTCRDKESGDKKSLMEDMCDAADSIRGTTKMTEQTAAVVIKMLKIKNGVGNNPSGILQGLNMQSEEYKENQKLIEKYDSACTVMMQGVDLTERQLKDGIKEQYNILSNQRKWAKEGEELCEKLVGKDGKGGIFAKLEKQLKKLQEQYKTWENAVNELSEGDSKTAYKENLAEVNRFFQEEGGIGECKQKITKNKSFYHDIWTQLDQTTFTGKQLDLEIKKKEDFAFGPSYEGVTSAEEIADNGAAYKQNYSSISIHPETENQDLKSDGFIILLKEKYCKENPDANKAKAREEAAKGDGALEDSMSKLTTLFTSDDVVDSMKSTDLPSVWLNTPKTKQESQQPQLQSGLANEGKRKKVSNSGSEGLNTDDSIMGAVSNLPQLLSEAGANVAKPLYLTEYVMGMFSYYTCDKDNEGKKIEDPKSLNGQSLKDNALYRAEVEYILWGDTDVRANISKTKAVIYTINLIFNMSFVFTDSTLKGQALATASLFPVPMVGRTAIKCALQVAAALVETVKNLEDICSGKEVPLLKNSGNWNTWIPSYSSSGKPASVNAKTISFTYEDYLWMFVCVSMYTSSDEKLARIADCIELNLGEDTLKNMFTMVQVETKVSVDTYFLNKLNGAGYDVQKVDKDTFRIPYVGIAGY